ncbi:hypothetical protein [Pseudoalteromonas nigrifaciens]|uniref:hypothetical protein n=1 Tax=Pseudoalteromonas nigrifaciens TaxID=28109 RepID=UPI003FD2CD64
MKDDLKDFISTRKPSESENESEKPLNLIEQAEKENASNGGRPKKLDTEKANQRVVGYITKSDKVIFNTKRGLVSESKIISALIAKWVNGDVEI